MKKFLPLLLLMMHLPAMAATPEQIDYVVRQILIKEEATFLTYEVGDKGRVYVTFGRNEPEWRIQNTVKALQSHPDIPGLSWSKIDADFCFIR